MTRTDLISNYAAGIAAVFAADRPSMDEMRAILEREFEKYTLALDALGALTWMAGAMERNQITDANARQQTTNGTQANE